MSNQMFYPQENEPGGPEERQANSDPREQYADYQAPPESDYARDASYERGYSGYAANMGGEKLRPRQNFSQRQWLWIIVAVMALIIAGGWIFNFVSGFVFTLIGIAIIAYILWRVAFNQRVELPSQSFVVSGKADLIIDNVFGGIRIHRGPVSAVEVRATRYYSSFLPSRPSYPLDVTQQENQIKVNVWSSPARRIFSPDVGRIDLDITAPELCDVHIRSDASSVSIDGIRGQAIIQTNAGTIDVKNAFLVGNSTAHTNAGTIRLQDVRLEGGARMDTNAGTIAFRGSLQAGSHYYFETNAGTIDMALPASAAFVLDARTDLGTMNNRFGSNSVGTGPQAMLHLRTNLGTITVRPM